MIRSVCPARRRLPLARLADFGADVDADAGAPAARGLALALVLTLALALALALSPGLAAASGHGEAPMRPDPADAQATVPPLEHRSAFGAYRGMTDEDVGAWREANDQVGRIGGWRVYAREAEGAAAPAAPTATPTALPPTTPAAAPARAAPNAPANPPAPGGHRHGAH